MVSLRWNKNKERNKINKGIGQIPRFGENYGHYRKEKKVEWIAQIEGLSGGGIARNFGSRNAKNYEDMRNSCLIKL